MFPLVATNSFFFSDEASSFSGARVQFGSLNSMVQNPNFVVPAPKAKKKRNHPGNPDPEAEVIALSPTCLMTENRFVCEVCKKGFQREQNLQLHRRGHVNLPWKLKQRNGSENRKRVYVCPEPTCLHHHPSRALGDLTGIKKHFFRKHGEKKWKCDKCSKTYAVQSDWKAHSKTCGTKEYKCDCGTLFSRRDSFISHKTLCDALTAETAKISTATSSIMKPNPTPTPTKPFLFNHQNLLPFSSHPRQFCNPWEPPQSLPLPAPQNHIPTLSSSLFNDGGFNPSQFESYHQVTPSVQPLSATALLQMAATMGVSTMGSTIAAQLDMLKTNDGMTRDFLGLTGDPCSGSNDGVGTLLKQNGFGFTESCSGWKIAR